MSLFLPREHSPDCRQNTIYSVSHSKQNGAVDNHPAHASAFDFWRMRIHVIIFALRL